MSPSPCPTSSPGRLLPDVSGVSLLRRDAGSGGTIAANGSANCPAAPKMGGPSFAAVVSSPSTGARAKLLLSVSRSPPTQPWQKHSSPPRPSSLGPSPLGDNNSNSKNSVLNTSSFSIGNGVANNTSPHSTLSSASSTGSSPSCMPNMSHGDPAQDSGDDDIENDQEDTESSDLEIYLSTVDSRSNLDARMNVIACSSSAYSSGTSTSNVTNSSYTSLQSDPQSPFHFQSPPAETEHMAACIASNQGGGDLVQTLQEKYVTKIPSVLGTYGNGNGYTFAHAYDGLGVSATTSISNDAGSKMSIAALQVGNASPDPIQGPPKHPHKTLLAQQQVNAPQSPALGSSRDPTPLPKPPLHHNSSLDDSYKTPFAQPPSPNTTIGLSSSNGLPQRNALTPSRGIGVTAANAGSHHGQMGIAVSGSPTPSQITSVKNANFSSSASEPILNGSSNIDDDNANSASLIGNGDFNCGPAVKIPNVYINGLPPHFPEDELFNLCNEFGPIRSVRTFTRHVRDSESGYGFVLFENLDDAERCIVSLRRFRNLHPTFSKQIHKIPGTGYAVGPSTSATTWNVSATGDSTGKGNFKAKMESLHDPTSTNLYMEGLPLDITAAELIALVSPHRIVSARGFPTKLSKPPRAIVFVRLETRPGAEEIIERLHGRMMDDGERLSVRFADSSEQKELRRAERAVQDGDTSPSRLTIAQASLLNLRGQGLRPDGKTNSVHPVTGAPLTAPTSARGFSSSISAPEFLSNTQSLNFIPGHPNSNAPIIGNAGVTTGNGLEVDYFALSGSPYNRELHADQQYGIVQPSHGRFALGQQLSVGDPPISALLDTLRTNSTPSGRSAYGDAFNLEGDLFAQNRNMRLGPHQIHGASYGQQRHHLPISHSLDSFNQGYIRPSPAYTRSGYTPTEEYIMRVHAESAALAQSQQLQQAPDQLHYMPQHVERGRPARLDMNRQRPMGMEDAANITVGMRAYRAQASLMSPSGISGSDSLNSISSLSSADGLRVGAGAFGRPTNGVVTTEEEFHARGSSSNMLRSIQTSKVPYEFSSYQTAQRSMPIAPSLPFSYHQNQGGSSPSAADEAPTQPLASPDPNDTVISAYHQHGSTVHMRSTTLPQQRPSAVANNVKGHHQHSSMSMPKMTLGTPQHASVARLGGLGSSNLAESPTGTIYETEAQEGVEKQMPKESISYTPDTASSVYSATVNAGSSVSLKTHYSSSSTVFDVDQSSTSPLSPSSSLISPTLTYGSQTPSTLSPATPFFGSFNHNVESFDKAAGEQQPIHKKLHSVMSALRTGSC